MKKHVAGRRRWCGLVGGLEQVIAWKYEKATFRPKPTFQSEVEMAASHKIPDILLCQLAKKFVALASCCMPFQFYQPAQNTPSNENITPVSGAWQ
jgi:hypothetical protein